MKKSERWSSHNEQREPSKNMKHKFSDYQDKYTSDRSYEMDRGRRQLIEADARPQKNRSPMTHSISRVRDVDLERGRKRKQRSPFASPQNTSVSPSSFPSKHDAKRQRYASPSPRMQHVDEKIYERGRSRERKERKPKDIKKFEKTQAEMSRSYDYYKGGNLQEYRDRSLEYKQKSSPGFVRHDQIKSTKGYKDKKYSDYEVEQKPKKHQRIIREQSPSPLPDVWHSKADSLKVSQQRHKMPKEEIGYASEEERRVSSKKMKKHEVQQFEEVKPKKKTKVEIDDRSSSSYQHKSRTSYESGFSRSPSPQKHVKHKDLKKAEYMVDPETDDLGSKKMKAKKKKKQKQEEETEQYKKKKVKHPKVEELDLPRKKSMEQTEKDDVKDKTKKVKKRKRTREDSTSPHSGSIGEEYSRKKFHEERVEHKWRPADEIDEPQLLQPKRKEYIKPSHDPSSQHEKKPKHHKAAPARWESPESASSRSGSRQHRSPPPPVQKHRKESSLEFDSYRAHGSGREENRARDLLSSERKYQEEAELRQRNRDRDYVKRIVEKYENQPSKERQFEERFERHGNEKNHAIREGHKTQYHDKRVQSSYQDKRGLERDRRSLELQYSEKNARYDDLQQRDKYLEPRKPRSDFPERGDSRNRPNIHHKPAQLPDSRKDFRQIREAQQSSWQPDHSRRQRDAGPSEFDQRAQRMASWVGGREGTKLRIEARDPQLLRDVRQPRMKEKPDAHALREDTRDQRGMRREVRDMPTMQENRRKEKWFHPQKPSVPQHRTFPDDRTRILSGDRMSSHPLEEQSSSSPAFYRQVSTRRSGERLSHDLSIEVTIRDDGRRSNDYDKTRKLRQSPARLVSSFEGSRSRERPTTGTLRDNSSSSELHGRHNRNISSRSASTNRYQQRLKDVPKQGLDRSANRDQVPGMAEPKKQFTPQGYRSNVLKPFKHDRSRSLADRIRFRQASLADREKSRDFSAITRDSSVTDRDRSRESSAANRDRSRESSAANRDRSRESSAANRDRSRGSSRRTRHQNLPNEKSERKSSKSKSRRDDAKKDSKVKSKSDKNPEKEDATPKAADVLDVDWTGLTSSNKKDSKPDIPNSSVLKRFTPGNVLLRMGVSTKLLPPDLVKKVEEKCKAEASDSDGGENLPLVLDQGLGALNHAAALRQHSWNNAFNCRTSQNLRLTSFGDAKFRQHILGIEEDLRFPYQPPLVINAKSYAASLKHYLNKTKPIVYAA
ncbi:unnamed protein product [Clavelina lepadiformis]|uniref:Uncharacterized protein n=1 Tax=Clavelina lepadiformis TaxID=159417 RepID=A0ABP0F0A6_CLALP